jgi:hypothetical protein
MRNSTAPTISLSDGPEAAVARQPRAGSAACAARLDGTGRFVSAAGGPLTLTVTEGANRFGPPRSETSDKVGWTNPLRGSRLIETTFHDFRGPVADNARPLA